MKGFRTAPLPYMCHFGMWVILTKGIQVPAGSRETFAHHLITQKNLNWGSYPEEGLSTEINFIWVTHLYGRANISLLNISYCPVRCIPFLWSPRPLPFSVVQDDIHTLFSWPSLEFPCLCGFPLCSLFDLLLVCLVSIWFLVGLEGPLRGHEFSLHDARKSLHKNRREKNPLNQQAIQGIGKTERNLLFYIVKRIQPFTDVLSR